MATNPLAMALSNSDPRLRSRLLMAQNMAEEGGSTAPVQSPLEGLARALKGGLGGYFAGEVDREEKGKKAEAQQVLARALSAGAGTENTFDSKTGQWSAPSGKADPALMAKILAGNEQTAPMGLNLQLQEMQYGRTRADQLADRDAALKNSLLQNGLALQPDGSIAPIPGFGQAQGANTAAAAQQTIPVDVARQQAMMPGAIQQAGGVAAASAQGALPSQMQLSQFNANQTLANAQPLAQSQAAGTLAAQNAPVTVQGSNGPVQVPAAAAADIAKNAAVPKPMTDTQAASALYADRMSEASKIINQLEAQGAQPGESSRIVRGIPLIGNSFIGNNMVSENVQKYEQAQRDFVNAVLRKESGAVISDEEFANARQQYFAQPGDAPAVIEQKRKNRELALAGIARSAGPGYQPAGIQSAPASATGGTPPPPPGFVVQ